MNTLVFIGQAMAHHQADKRRSLATRQRGFTLVEMLVTIVIVAILASAVFPLTHLANRRAKETQLRNSLQQIRNAIDAYKKAADNGHITLQAGQSGYPPNLQILMDGVVDAKPTQAGGVNGNSGVSTSQRIYFLRHIPRDPMNEDLQLSAADTWGLRSYASSHEEPKAEADVFDVYSLSTAVGLNELPYNTW